MAVQSNAKIDRSLRRMKSFTKCGESSLSNIAEVRQTAISDIIHKQDMLKNT